MSKTDEWVEGLQGSLQRACEVFYDPVLQKTEEGHTVYLRLSEMLTPELKAPVKTYVRRYCHAQGWAMKKLTFERGFLKFQITRESPKPRRGGQKKTS